MKIVLNFKGYRIEVVVTISVIAGILALFL